MKSLIAILVLFTGLLHAQTSKRTNDFKLQGSWTISKYTFMHISAMTEEVAQEWKGKKATVGKVIHFPYYDIPSYKDLFKNNVYCGYLDSRKLYPDTTVSTESYFGQFKINHAELGIKSKTIRLVRTPCKDSPFGEMIVKNDNEILIYWDGTFFTLSRDKK